MDNLVVLGNVLALRRQSLLYLVDASDKRIEASAKSVSGILACAVARKLSHDVALPQFRKLSMNLVAPLIRRRDVCGREVSHSLFPPSTITPSPLHWPVALLNGVG
jgi:hypothetical protein